MDATDLLKNDHDALRLLFARYGELEVGDLTEKALLFGRLARELEAHAAIEEELFYPTVRNANPATAGAIIREAFEEHLLMRRILGDLQQEVPGTDDFDAKLAVLRENVLRHAEEDEREVFAEARASLTPLQLRLLGGRLEDRKRDLGGRVHRNAPVLDRARRVFSRVRRAVSRAVRQARGSRPVRARRSTPERLR
jgi:hypothetical protein